MRYLSLFIIALTLSGCSLILEYPGRLLWTGPGRSVKQIDSTEITRLIITYSEKLKVEKKIKLEDSVIVYEYRVNRIRLDYSSMEALDVWDARDLLVDVVEEFLERINGNAIIYPQLSRTPMTASDLEIYITFPSFYNKYVDLQTVGLISLRQGIVHIIASDGFDCETDCWHNRTEYYFQSRNFVKFRREGEALYKPQAESEIEKIFEEEMYNRNVGSVPPYQPPKATPSKPASSTSSNQAKTGPSANKGSIPTTPTIR